MAQPTECQVVNESTMARQLPKVTPLFAAFFVFSFIFPPLQLARFIPGGVLEGVLAPSIH